MKIIKKIIKFSFQRLAVSGKRRSLKKSPASALILGAIVILAVIGFMVIVVGIALMTELTGNNSGGGTTGGLCDEIPAKYQTIFLGAARGEIPPSLIAAIFVVEHGRVEEYRTGYTPTNSRNDRWPEKDGDPQAITRWKTSTAGAEGPMQFTPTTWTQYGTGGNVQNITDATRGTGNMLKKNYDTQSGTQEERLKKVIARYNPGAGSWNNSWYVDRVWGFYQKFNCAAGGKVLAGRMDVPFIDQRQYGWCGRASQAMVAAFFDPSNFSKYDSYQFLHDHPLNENTLQQLTKKNYRYGNPSLNTVINSLKNGYPAIVYTDIYGQHIFVLTGFDGTRFWANDTMSKITNHKDTQVLGGVPLTRENLQKHLTPQGGHTFLYVP